MVLSFWLEVFILKKGEMVMAIRFLSGQKLQEEPVE
jgi:hypothetical protein